MVREIVTEVQEIKEEVFRRRSHVGDVKCRSLFSLSYGSPVQSSTDRPDDTCVEITDLLFHCSNCMYSRLIINALKLKRRPFHLKTQSVPRCKHFSSRL